MEHFEKADDLLSIDPSAQVSSMADLELSSRGTRIIVVPIVELIALSKSSPLEVSEMSS